MERRDKMNYYLDIAETVLERGTCLRRKYGAIIVNNDEIISTGYVGAPRGRTRLYGSWLLHPLEAQYPPGESGMSCAAACMPRRTLYHLRFPQRHAGGYAVFWWAGMWTLVSWCMTPAAAPCVSAS